MYECEYCSIVRFVTWKHCTAYWDEYRAVIKADRLDQKPKPENCATLSYQYRAMNIGTCPDLDNCASKIAYEAKKQVDTRIRVRNLWRRCIKTLRFEMHREAFAEKYFKRKLVPDLKPAESFLAVASRAENNTSRQKAEKTKAEIKKVQDAVKGQWKDYGEQDGSDAAVESCSDSSMPVSAPKPKAKGGYAMERQYGRRGNIGIQKDNVVDQRAGTDEDEREYLRCRYLPFDIPPVWKPTNPVKYFRKTGTVDKVVESQGISEDMVQNKLDSAEIEPDFSVAGIGSSSKSAESIASECSTSSSSIGSDMFFTPPTEPTLSKDMGFKSDEDKETISAWKPAEIEVFYAACEIPSASQGNSAYIPTGMSIESAEPDLYGSGNTGTGIASSSTSAPRAGSPAQQPLGDAAPLLSDSQLQNTRQVHPPPGLGFANMQPVCPGTPLAFRAVFEPGQPQPQQRAVRPPPGFGFEQPRYISDNQTTTTWTHESRQIPTQRYPTQRYTTPVYGNFPPAQRSHEHIPSCMVQPPPGFGNVNPAFRHSGIPYNFRGGFPLQSNGSENTPSSENQAVGYNMGITYYAPTTVFVPVTVFAPMRPPPGSGL